jgi:hypothetical protein
MVLKARTLDAFVRSAGAATNVSAENGLCVRVAGSIEIEIGLMLLKIILFGAHHNRPRLDCPLLFGSVVFEFVNESGGCVRCCKLRGLHKKNHGFREFNGNFKDYSDGTGAAIGGDAV